MSRTKTALRRQGKGCLIGLLVCGLSGCMSLVLQPGRENVPISLSSQIYGYQTGHVLRHLSREIWTYHLLGLPQFPLGTREGLGTNELISAAIQADVSPGQGVIRLQIRHTRTPLTWLATIFSLGLLSPTAVIIDGDVVPLQRQQPAPPSSSLD